MTFFLIDNSFKIMPRLKKGLTFLALCCSIPLFAALTPIPVPPDIVVFCGNPLRVDEYIDSLDIRPHSDLAHVICQLPVDAKEFIEALDKMHPALLQDLTLLTNENMQTVRQTFLGRNSFLRFDKCKTFDCLYGDCNLGPSEMWFTTFGNFANQTHIDQLHGYRSTTPGLMIGVDSQPNKNTVLGFGLGYSYSDLHWKKGYGTADCSTGYFGVYGSSIHDHFYVDAAVLGSYSFYKTVRHIEFQKFLEEYEDFYCDNREKPRCKKRNRHRNREAPCESHSCSQRDSEGNCEGNDCCRICQLNGEEGEIDEACCRIPPPPCRCGIDREARSRFRGYGILSHIGIGGKLTICGLDIIPFGSVDYNFVDQDGHDEHKARSLNLRIRANHAHLLRTEAGLTLKGCIPYNCAWFRPSLTVSYIRKQVLQGDRFRAGFVNYNEFEQADFFGSRKPIGYICPGFGLEVQTSSQYIVSFNYDAELNRQQITQRLTLRFQRAY